jgi:voltage-gated potassium channel
MAARWDRMTTWPLTVMAIVFLVAYAWPIVDPELPAGGQALAGVVTSITWIAFAIDYAVRVSLAEQRWQYVVRHPLELASVALPLVRPLRLLRLLTLLSVLHRHAASSLRGKLAVYAGGSAALLSGVAGLAVLDAERASPDANITDIGDALWWALTTMTTVGYGDRFPVTTTGRFLGAGLMLGGIALLGVVTATIASWLVQRVGEEGERREAATAAQVTELLDEMRALRAELFDRSQTNGSSPRPPRP